MRFLIHQARFNRRHRHRHHQVEGPEVEPGDEDGECGQHQERCEDAEVDAQRENVFRMYVCRARHSRSPHEIEQGKEENPDQIDQVPVQAGELDRRVVLGREMVSQRAGEHPGDDAHADQNVDAVQPGHEEVHAEEHVRVGPLHALERVELARQLPLVKLVRVLEILDHEEGPRQGESRREIGRRRPPVVHLEEPDRQRHRERTRDEHEGVDRAARRVEEGVPVVEYLRVPGAVDGVGAEQPAEEEDLGQQEDPHSELGRVFLLGRVAEVVGQVFRVPVAGRPRRFHPFFRHAHETTSGRTARPPGSTFTGITRS